MKRIKKSEEVVIEDNNNTRELETKIKFWIPFNREQNSFTNAMDNENKEVDVKNEEPIQHDSKVSVEQTWQQPPINQPLRYIGQITLDKKENKSTV